MDPAEQMVPVNVIVNSSQLIVQHFVILTQHAMAKELVETRDIANVGMVYMEKIAQLHVKLQPIAVVMEPAQQMVPVNVIINSSQLIVQHIVILSQHAMAKELVDWMATANVLMVK